MKFILKIREDLKNLTRLNRSLQDSEIERILSGIGIYMVSSVRKNFENGGRPKKWKVLKDETLKRKRGNKILVDSALLSGGIMTETASGERAVYIGPSGPGAKYGRRHNYGDENGEPIPQRQFLVMQDEDSDYIDDFIRVSML